MGSLPVDLPSEDDEDMERIPCSGFRVKYLGCATFTLRKKRTPKGIASMQRPLLEVYSDARKKGDSQRSTHLFALDQRLDVLEYGLVLAQRGNASSHRNGSAIDREEDLVLVKVLTPLSNAVLWAAVRFQARALKRRVLGAAFVPLACCDAVLDRKGFLRLDSKQRFLVSLSHPSVFSCVFRRVTDPKSFECHAFACGSAREALALGSALSLVREKCDMPPLTRPPWPPPPQPLPSHYVINGSGPPSTSTTSQRRLLLPPNVRRHRGGNRTTESEGDESNSYASVHKFSKHPPSGRRLLTGRRGHRLEADGGCNTSESSASGVRGRRSQKTLFVRHEPIGGSLVAAGITTTKAREDTDIDDEAGLWMPVVKASSLPEKFQNHRPDTMTSPGNKNSQQQPHTMASNREPPSSSSSATTPSDTSCSAEYLEVGKSRRFIDDGGVDSTRRRRDVWTMTEAEQEKTIDLSSESSSLGGGVDFEDEIGSNDNRLPTTRATGLFSNKTTNKTTTAAASMTATPRETGTDAPVKYTYFGYETYRAPTWIPTKTNSSHRSLPDENDNNSMGQNERGDVTRERRYRHDKTYVKHQGTTSESHWDHTRSGIHNTKPSTTAKPAVILGNGTGKVTINVPFCKRKNNKNKSIVGRSSNGGGGRSSVASSSTQTDDASSSVVVLLPTRGVRSFRSDGRVGDWSTMSQTTSEEGVPSILRSGRHRDGQESSSSSTYSNSKFSHHPHHHHSSRSRTQRPQKMLRWRSEDRIPAHRSFFWSLKRLSLQSLTKAKHKTGKFISSMRTKLMGSRKSPDGSEDSAYDTAEVCLSPSGKGSHYATAPTTYYTDDDRVQPASRSGPKAHRQQSWSFHDLREAGLDRNTRDSGVMYSSSRNVRSASDEESAGGRSSRTSLRKSKDNARQQSSSSKRRTRRIKHRRRHSSASDSGVEEYYPSDGSGLRKAGSEKTLGFGNKQVTRVEVHHGMSDDTFHRWSHTNLQEELGYIP